ncbi:MAG: hypothetical protein AAGH60_08000 [Pseudomonadota bacterium]
MTRRTHSIDGNPDVAKPQMLGGLTRRAAVGAACLGALAACQARPLYSTGTSTALAGNDTPDLKAALGRIEIVAPADRQTQLVRNELVFLLQDDQAAADPAYRLNLEVRAVERSTTLSNSGSSPTVSLLMIADHSLIDMTTARELDSKRAIATSTFERVEQRFANQRARIDAERRAASEVAAIIVAQLSIALAQG